MASFDSTPNPAEDMKHAQALLQQMSPEKLLRATWALEDILEGAIYVSHDSQIEDEAIDDAERLAVEQGRRDVAAGRVSSLEDLLEACGLPKDALQAADSNTI